MNSVISEMPGPEVAVKARAPFHEAPITMPMEASSSSPCTIEYFAWPVLGSCRSFLQWLATALAALVGLFRPQADRAFEVLQRPVAAEMQRVDVRRQQFFLAFVLFADQLLDQFGVHVEQRAERSEIDDVLEQLALARIGIGGVG